MALPFIVFLIISVCLFIKIGTSMKALVKPTPYANYDETYCSLTLQILKLNRINLFMVAFWNGFKALQFLSGRFYVDIFLSSNFKTCAPSSTFSQVSVLGIVNTILSQVPEGVRLLIILV